jgi:DNA-directed RNA polymerase alpha subunit
MDIYIGPANRRRRHSIVPPEPKTPIADTLLCNTDLTVKTCNGLEEYGIFTLGDLAAKDSEFIVNMRNAGKATLHMCIDVLEEYGIPHTLVRNFKKPKPPAAEKPKKTEKSQDKSCFYFDIMDSLHLD